MKGIDISHHNGSIDFNAVKKEGYEIVYIKATEGKTYNDPTTQNNYNGAKAAGLKIGFYHFLRANDPREEAKHFLDVINGLDVNCKYCIDVETTEGQSKDQISARVRAFADYLISQGKEVCIYTGDNFYANYLNDTVKDLPLWVAHYGVDKPNVNNYAGFQYTSTGRVNGIGGNVDLNDFKNDIFINIQQPNPAPVNTVKCDEGIKALQQNLISLGYNPGVIDGIWGSNTKAAVVAFQTVMGVEPDGIVGKITTGALNEVLAKPTLRNGARGYAVRQLQFMLTSKGFNPGGVDGIFGNNTESAVKKFQKASKISVDGIVGKVTWSKLS